VSVPYELSDEDDHDRRNQNDVRVRFNHVRDYTVPVTEELMDLCAEGALSIQVWGHRIAGFTGTTRRPKKKTFPSSSTPKADL